MVKYQSVKLSTEILELVLDEQYKAFLKKDLGVTRQILAKLKPAIKSSQIIIITGLRRVGKSTLLAQIAKKYFSDKFYFVNFEDERLLNFRSQDFDTLYQTLISLYGSKKVFLFDEIQNVPQWERFVRRLHDQGFKFIITGSNASLLSKELGTRLTGRSIRIDLYPFSFIEYLDYKNIPMPTSKILSTKKSGQLLKQIRDYLNQGGIPDFLKYPKLPIHKALYDDVLYRDIATRYKLDNTSNIKELSLFLLSNISSLISFNKLKDLLKLGSVNTVKSYIDFLENSWLFFTVKKYAYSVKEQQIAPKKIYSIDTGLSKSIGFSFSSNTGRFMENLVYLYLRQNNLTPFYYKTQTGFEVDFFIPHKRLLIQVCQNLDDQTKDREVRALVDASKEQPQSKLLIISENIIDTIIVDDQAIKVIPLFKWLLTDPIL